MVVGETQGHGAALLELEVAGHGVLQAKVDTDERRELLVEHQLLDVVFRNDEVGVLVGLDGGSLLSSSIPFSIIAAADRR